jgi:K+-transporting ATPase A subunit
MNNPNAWLQLSLYVGALLLITKPLGLYLMQVLDVHGRTWLDPLVRPIENLTCAASNGSRSSPGSDTQAHCLPSAWSECCSLISF